jgi:hypothetical protein
MGTRKTPTAYIDSHGIRVSAAPEPRICRPCRDPKRHAPLTHAMLEYQRIGHEEVRVCAWCDPQSAYPSWGHSINELLSAEQLALVQELRREEGQ